MKWCIGIIVKDALEEKPEAIKILRSSLKIMKITLISGGRDGEERTNARVM